MTVPLMNPAPSEQRNATVAATSAAVPSRCIGVLRATICIMRSGSSDRAATRANRPVSVADGDTTLTRT